MKIYRYIISFILIIVGLLLTSELVITNIDTASEYGYPHIEFNFDKDNREEAAALIADLAKKYNIQVYIADVFSPAQNEIKHVYYTTDGAEATVRESLSIPNHNIMSIDSGVHSFDVLPLTENYSELSFYHNISMMGNSSDVDAFVSDFKEQYSDVQYTPADLRNVKNSNIIGYVVWGIIVALLSAIAFYEVSAQKKEAAVLLSLGNSVWRFIARNILQDAVVYSCELLAAAGIVIFLGFAHSAIKYAVISVLAVLLLTLLSSLMLLSANIRACISGYVSGKSIIRYNYFIKLLMIVASMISAAHFVGLVQSNSMNFKAEATIDEYFSGYYYTNVISAYQQNGGDINYNNVKEIVYRIYSDKFYELKPLVLHGMDKSNPPASGNSYIVNANRYAIEYLSSEIPELKGVDLTHNYYLIVPESVPDSYIENWQKDLREYQDEEYFVIRYSGDVQILSIDAHTDTGIDYYKNPIIELNNTTPEYMIEKDIISDYDALLLDNASIEKLCEEYSLDKNNLEATTISESYSYRWRVLKAEVFSAGSISLLMLILEVMITVSILKVTFSMNAKELCIKKILGHGVIERYLVRFSLNLLMTVISVVIMIYYTSEMGSVLSNNTFFILLFGEFIFITDTLFTLLYINKTERASIQKILKGGAL